MNSNKVMSVSDEVFIEIVNNSKTISEIAKKLGFKHSPGAGSKERIRQRMNNLKCSIKTTNRVKLDIELVKDAIDNTKSMASAARYVGVNIKTFREYAKKYNLWNTNPSRKGMCIKDFQDVTYIKYKKIFEEKLHKNSKITTSKLRNWLLIYGFKEHICERCGLTVWNNEKIPLDVHHIDGDQLNNELENLLLLCPNCHRQTENFGAKNLKFKDSIRKKKHQS